MRYFDERQGGRVQTVDAITIIASMVPLVLMVRSPDTVQAKTIGRKKAPHLIDARLASSAS